jgi:hypothetical protein
MASSLLSMSRRVSKSTTVAVGEAAQDKGVECKPTTGKGHPAVGWHLDMLWQLCARQIKFS